MIVKEEKGWFVNERVVRSEWFSGNGERVKNGV